MNSKQIIAQVARALAASESTRTDSPSRVPGLDAARAVTRAALAQTEEPGRRADARRAALVTEALRDALGIRIADGRADADYFAGELIDRSGPIVRDAPNRRAVMASLPTRNVNPGAQVYESRFVGYTGEPAVWSGNANDVPQADYAAASKLYPMHAFAIKTSIDWRATLHGSLSDIDAAAEKAEAATRALLDMHEKALINGVAGLDYRQIAATGIPALSSSLDYAAGATTLDDMHADLSKLLDQIELAAADRGEYADSVLISSNWLRALRGKSNYDAGGDATGLVVLAGLTAANAAMGRLFEQRGIRNIIAAPSLNAYGGVANRGALVTFRAGDLESLHQVVGMTPALVDTARVLGGEQSLFALIAGGCDAPEKSGCGVISAKVL